MFASKRVSGPRLTVDYQREAVVFRLADDLPVYTHYSFALTALIITAPLWFQGRMSGVVIALALTVILFLSILGHELGHVAAARAQKARARSIEIGLFGGKAWLEWDDHRGMAMRPVALAGPMVNLALAGLFFALYWMAGYGAADAAQHVVPFETPAILPRTLQLAAILNLGLGLINLLPAFPLDGGTIMQDILSGRIGARRATLIVGALGLALTSIAAVGTLVALLLGTPIFAPLSFRQNWRAIVENRRIKLHQLRTTMPFAKPTKVVTFRARSRNPGGTP
jgi:stage IV sporulation protein FB